jgi:hypothetical protein
MDHAHTALPLLWHIGETATMEGRTLGENRRIEVEERVDGPVLGLRLLYRPFRPITPSASCVGCSGGTSVKGRAATRRTAAAALPRSEGTGESRPPAISSFLSKISQPFNCHTSESAYETDSIGATKFRC